MIRKFLIEEEIAPGVFRYRRPEASEWWPLLNFVVEARVIPYQQTPFAAPEYSKHQDRLGLSYGWFLKRPHYEVSLNELDEKGKAFSFEIISQRAESIVSNTEITLPVWRKLLGVKIRRKADVPDALARHPEAVLAYPDKLGGRVLRIRPEDYVTIEGVPGRVVKPECNSITGLGDKPMRFVWQKHYHDPESEPLDLEHAGPEAITEARINVKKLVLSQTTARSFWSPMTTTPLKLEHTLASLEEAFKIEKTNTWVKTCIKGFASCADHQYAEGLEGEIVMVEVLEQSGWYRRRQMETPLIPVDIQKVGYFLEILGEEQGGGGKWYVCRVALKGEHSWVLALRKPSARGRCLIRAWRGMQLC